MYGCNHDVELGEHLIGQIEFAVFENIDLDSREQANAIHLGRANFTRMRPRSLFVHPISHGHGLAVVGDGHVFVAFFPRCLRHLLDRVAPVAFRGVHLQIAAQIGLLDQLWQSMFGCGFDFAAILAQLRRNEVQLELGVDLLLARACHAPFLLQRRQRVFVQRAAHLQRAPAQRDIVFLGAGEID